jgi:kinesin family protein C1
LCCPSSWQGESLRRKLHNTIQDLRGAVRVVSRVRPFLAADGSSPAPSVLEPSPDGAGLSIRSHTGRTLQDGKEDTGGEKYEFQFDQGETSALLLAA